MYLGNEEIYSTFDMQYFNYYLVTRLIRPFNDQSSHMRTHVKKTPLKIHLMYLGNEEI